VNYWWITFDGDEYAAELYRRHYSRRIYRDGRKPKKILGPGEYLLLRTWECDAIWAWRKFIDASGQQGINNAIFRNESEIRSSDLIRQADQIGFAAWPSERHYTYINEKKIRSTNPGYCYQMAGWKKCGKTKGGLIIMEKYPSKHN
jgi:hypothetical protein